MNILNYDVTPHYPPYPARRKTIVNTLNPHLYCVAKKDPLFRDALKSGDYLLPDGIGIVMAAKWLNRDQIERIAGYDVFIYLMKNMNIDGGTCFLMGAAPKTLKLIKQRASKDFPNVKVHSYSPPNKREFSVEDNNQMIAAVNQINPDVLFVGMTAPIREKWVHINKENVNSNIICSIGAVFEFYAGTIPRPSKFWIDLRLEWLRRFVNEPRRLFHRNFISTPLFLLDVVRAAAKAR